MNKFIMLPDLDSGIIYNINVDHICCYHSAGVNERDGVCIILTSGKPSFESMERFVCKW